MVNDIIIIIVETLQCNVSTMMMAIAFAIVIITMPNPWSIIAQINFRQN